MWPGEKCHSLQVTPARVKMKATLILLFPPLGCFYPAGLDWLCSSAPCGSPGFSRGGTGGGKLPGTAALLPSPEKPPQANSHQI